MMKCECCSKEFENTEHQCTVKVNLGWRCLYFCSLECVFEYYKRSIMERTMTKLQVLAIGFLSGMMFSIVFTVLYHILM